MGPRAASDRVVLLHGQPGNGAEWNRVVRALGGSVDAVAPDRPGYGRNPLPAGGVLANVDWMARLLEQDGDRRPRLIVAHSWAGSLALAFALRHPDLTRGLVLVGSVGPGAITRVDRLLAGPVTARVLPTRPGGTERNRARRARAVLRAFLTEELALVRELPGLLDQLDRVGTATTVIAGTRDRIVPVATAVALVALLPSADLVAVPGGGHRLHRTHPDLVAGAVRRALAASATS